MADRHSSEGFVGDCGGALVLATTPAAITPTAQTSAREGKS